MIFRGCGLDGPPNSGGPAFNAGDGGVYATKWTSEGIKMCLGFIDRVFSGGESHICKSHVMWWKNRVIEISHD